jgi:NADH-quinone oxidoreductase subunit N
VSATDLAVLVVAIEIVAIAGYALVAAAHTDASREAAVKYVIQGAVATALGILGIGLAFAFGGGELAYGPVSDALKAEGGREVLLAAVLVLSLLVFKVGGFPFHSWAPDAFETAKPAEAAFLASVPKLAAFTALVVLFNASVFAGAMPVTATLFGILAAASIAFGNLAALGQQSVGRMLGYSAIAHAGYGLVGLAAGGAASLTAIFFAGTYALGAVLAFLGLQAVRDARPSWDGSRSGLSGLAGTAPWASAVVAVGMLSLTGMPLFVGFWGKLAVFIAAVQAGHTWLAVVGVIGSVISFGYYGAVIRSLYFESPAEGGDEAVPARRSRSAIAVAILLAAVVVLLGVLPLLTGLTPAYSLLTFR